MITVRRVYLIFEVQLSEAPEARLPTLSVNTNKFLNRLWELTNE